MMTLKGISLQEARTGGAIWSFHEFLVAQNLSVRVTRLLNAGVEVLKGSSETEWEGMNTEEISTV